MRARHCTTEIQSDMGLGFLSADFPSLIFFKFWPQVWYLYSILSWWLWGHTFTDYCNYQLLSTYDRKLSKVDWTRPEFGNCLIWGEEERRRGGKEERRRGGPPYPLIGKLDLEHFPSKVECFHIFEWLRIYLRLSCWQWMTHMNICRGQNFKQFILNIILLFRVQMEKVKLMDWKSMGF